MLNTLKDVVRKSSIHVCLVNCGGCNGCDVEIVALLSPRYDLEQYGIYVHSNPREADVILITGAVTEQWIKKIRRIYTKAPEPKVVACVGNCPLSGDVFNQEGEVFMLQFLILSQLMQKFLVVLQDQVKY